MVIAIKLWRIIMRGRVTRLGLSHLTPMFLSMRVELRYLSKVPYTMTYSIPFIIMAGPPLVCHRSAHWSRGTNPLHPLKG